VRLRDEVNGKKTFPSPGIYPRFGSCTNDTRASILTAFHGHQLLVAKTLKGTHTDRQKLNTVIEYSSDLQGTADWFILWEKKPRVFDSKYFVAL
jgi:hypothetical protein